MFHCRLKMTQKAREGEVSFKTFLDASLHSDMYCFVEAEKRFYSGNEPLHHSDIATNANDISETGVFNNRDKVVISPVLSGSHPSIQDPICSKTSIFSRSNDVQICGEFFEVWMETKEKKAADKRIEDEKN